MFQGLYEFLVINNFSSLITFFVGLFALFVYVWQKRDQKINAARLIISEIRAAESKVQEIIDLLPNKSRDFPIVLIVNSWSEKSYIFASELDQDELSEVNRFYNLCENINEYVRRDNEFFWITTQHRAALAQDLLSKFIVEKSFNEKKKSIDENKVNEFIDSILIKYTNHWYQYIPNKTITELQRLTTEFDRISTTTTGAKLKKIAKLDTKPWYHWLVQRIFG